METTILNITDYWLNLTSNQSLTNGKSYSIQNLSSNNIVLSIQAKQPAPNEGGNILNCHDSVILKQGFSNIFVRSYGNEGQGNKSRIVINEIN